jgi:peptidoglycan/xylan/chitin deacetylase (PgdA/CDA1 family)
MYHKVDIIAPTRWWVTKSTFSRQMAKLSNKHVVPLSDYKAEATQYVITFDDAYENVYRHAFPILRERGYPFEIFVNGALIGRWNRFDRGEPKTRICGIDQLIEMAEGGGRIQWHCRNHIDLTGLTRERVESEMKVPESLRSLFGPPNLQWFAYPYGAHTAEVVQLAREAFDGALSVYAGDLQDRFQLNRIIATEDMA